MRITDEVPTTWKDLQDKVCKYLNQCGYHAESPKTIELVRGKAEVDVYATTDDELLRQFICECKFWETPVPQEKIHAFRTVVHDSGSMLGIFISKEGYQEGAVKAAYCSNVVLKDWEGFIDMIALKWARNRFRAVLRLGDPLGVYTDFLDVPVEKLDEAGKTEYYRLQEKYVHPYMLSRSFEMGLFNPDAPVVLNDIQFEDLNSLFNYLEKTFIQGNKEFEYLFSKYKVDDWKLDFSEKMHFESCITDFLK